MKNKALIDNGNLNRKILITDNKIKEIEEPELLQRNKLKRWVRNNNKQAIKFIISMDKSKDNIKQKNG